MGAKTKKADIAKKTKAFIRKNSYRYMMFENKDAYYLQRFELMEIVYHAYQEGIDSVKSSKPEPAL
ncbi:MAG: hypothetical protein GX102_13735 [Porphyromonadaceae bacterium]|jgi:hypothetical protein|nr:hypothetical protein [Porphyromonadaceae bacterium]